MPLMVANCSPPHAASFHVLSACVKPCRVRVDDLQESEPGRGFDELVAFDAVEMAVEPCHALVRGCGGVFLERVPAGVAFGLFGGSLCFLLGVGGLVAAGPEVDLLRDRVDGYGGGIMFADLLDGFFGGAGGREHAAEVAPFRVAVGLFGVGDEVDAAVGLHEERGDRFDPLPVAVGAFDVAEDVVEVRGAGRLRELLLPVRLAVISRYGHELADGDLAEIVAGPPDLGLDAGTLARSRT